MNLKDLIERARGLEKNATPVEWKFVRSQNHHRNHSKLVIGLVQEPINRGVPQLITSFSDIARAGKRRNAPDCNWENDAQLICCLRNSLPTLTEQVDKLVSALKSISQDYYKKYPDWKLQQWKETVENDTHIARQALKDCGYGE